MVAPKMEVFFFSYILQIFCLKLKTGGHNKKYFEPYFPTGTFCLKCIWMQRTKLPIMVVR